MADPSRPDLPEQHVAPRPRPHDAPPGQDHPELAHEATDASPSSIIKFGIGLVVFGIIVHLVLAVMFSVLATRTDRDQPKLSPLAKKERTRLPQDLDRIPSPRLQKNDQADMEALRKEDDAKLNSYGWLNKEDGTVSIPI